MKNSLEQFQSNGNVTITGQRFQDIADHINDCFGSKFTKTQIMEADLPLNLLFEIANNGYQDTDQREQLVDFLANKYIGMPWPRYSDSKEIQDKFEKLAKEKGLVENEE